MSRKVKLNREVKTLNGQKRLRREFRVVNSIFPIPIGLHNHILNEKSLPHFYFVLYLSDIILKSIKYLIAF